MLVCISYILDLSLPKPVVRRLQEVWRAGGEPRALWQLCGGKSSPNVTHQLKQIISLSRNMLGVSIPLFRLAMCWMVKLICFSN